MLRRMKHAWLEAGVREASQTLAAAANASERFLVILVLAVAAAGVAGPAPGRAGSVPTGCSSC
jgi:hypothetical protein